LLTAVGVEKHADGLTVDDVRDDAVANESSVKAVHVGFASRASRCDAVDIANEI
jgi:hypothetical protein